MYRFPLDTEIYGYVYMIHDSLHDKYYIGVHKWIKNLKDVAILKTSFDYAYYESKGFPLFKIDPKYLGSGTYLKKAIHKYGRQYFYIWDILDIALSYEELYDLEVEWIRFYKDKGYDLYNLSSGGRGSKGISLKGSKNGMYGKHHSKHTKLLISQRNKGKPAWNKGKVNIYSEDTLQKLSQAHKKLRGKKSPQYGLKRAQESKDRMSKVKKNIKWLYKDDIKRGAMNAEEITALIKEGYSLKMTSEFYQRQYSKPNANKGKKFNKEKRCYE